MAAGSPKCEKQIRDTTPDNTRHTMESANVDVDDMAKAHTSIGPQNPNNPEQRAACTTKNTSSKGMPTPGPIEGHESQIQWCLQSCNAPFTGFCHETKIFLKPKYTKHQTYSTKAAFTSARFVCNITVTDIQQQQI